LPVRLVWICSISTAIGMFLLRAISPSASQNSFSKLTDVLRRASSIERLSTVEFLRRAEVEAMRQVSGKKVSHHPAKMAAPRDLSRGGESGQRRLTNAMSSVLFLTQKPRPFGQGFA